MCVVCVGGCRLAAMRSACAQAALQLLLLLLGQSKHRLPAGLQSRQPRVWPPCTLAPRRADKGGVVHAGLGKCSFAAEALHDNVGAFAAAILAARPKGVKGGAASGYMITAALSSSMGPGIPLNVASLVAAAQATKAKMEG